MNAEERTQDASDASLQSSFEDETDGCDVVFTDEDATTDEDLPAAEGGVA